MEKDTKAVRSSINSMICDWILSCLFLLIDYQQIF